MAKKYECIDCPSNILNDDAIKPLVSPDDEDYLDNEYNKLGNECRTITGGGGGDGGNFS